MFQNNDNVSTFYTSNQHKKNEQLLLQLKIKLNLSIDETKYFLGQL